MLRRIASLTVIIGMGVMSFYCSAGGSSGEDGDDPGTGGDNTDFNSGGSSSFNGEKCGESTFANQIPGSLLVILDRSGSMADPPEGSSTSKWSSTASALNTMTSNASQELNVGLLPFPAGNFDDGALLLCLTNPAAAGCDLILQDPGCTDVTTTPAVPVGPLSTTQSQIATWLSSNGPNGNTPTLYALRYGYDILRGLTTEGQRYALLMTDGEPTTYTPAVATLPEMGQVCGELADIEAEVTAGANGSPPVNTFVIGSPGSEDASEFLSNLAVNGNTSKQGCVPSLGDCHYQIGSTNFEQELQDVLQQIAGVISDCVFDIPEGDENVDPNLVNVVIETADGPVEIYKDPTHTNGWDYADSAKTKIQLFGEACELYKQQKGNTLTIILGCESVVR